jgi:glycosyltransferase involved in cell wall biosynthesis
MKVLLVRSRSIDSAVYKVADALTKGGHDVDLLVWDRQQNLNLDEKRDYKIHRFNLKAPHDSWSAMFYIPFWWMYVLYFLLKTRTDVIHACDLDTLWQGVLVKTLKGKKLCYTIYDFYSNNFPDVQPYILTRPFRGLIALIEKFGIGFTDILFLADECRLEEVKGARIKKVVYIYNSPPDRFKSLSSEPPKNKENLIVFYTGIIIRSRGLDYMIKAVEDLDNVKLIIAGSGPDSPHLQELIKNKKNIEYIGWIDSYEDVLKKTMESDVLFRFGDPIIPKVTYESPNKLFEAMMCGKPIIMNEEIAASRIVKQENCGLIVHYGEVSELQKALLKLSDLALRQNLGDNGRKAYERSYSWPIMEKRLSQEYNQLASSMNMTKHRIETTHFND